MVNKTIKRSGVKIVLKLKKDKELAANYHSTKTRRMFGILRNENFSEVFIKVSYGYYVDVWGNLEEFENSGIYRTKDEAIQALKAFLESGLLEYFGIKVTNNG